MNRFRTRPCGRAVPVLAESGCRGTGPRAGPLGPSPARGRPGSGYCRLLSCKTRCQTRAVAYSGRMAGGTCPVIRSSEYGMNHWGAGRAERMLRLWHVNEQRHRRERVVCQLGPAHSRGQRLEGLLVALGRPAVAEGVVGAAQRERMPPLPRNTSRASTPYRCSPPQAGRWD